MAEGSKFVNLKERGNAAAVEFEVTDSGVSDSD
jgi:hypothetical protein